MAYHFVAMAARLPVHTAGWKTKREDSNLHQLDDNDAARRALAWSELDICRMGRAARAGAGGAQALDGLDARKEMESTGHRGLGDHVCLRVFLLGAVSRAGFSLCDGDDGQDGGHPFRGSAVRIYLVVPGSAVRSRSALDR